MTERQEVAEKLREAAEDIEELSPYPAIVFNEITNIIDSNNIRCYKDFFNRLANFIDSTCHMKPNYVSPFSDPQWFTCDKCGNDTEQLENYCPNCGARVVIEDAKKHC